jgi:hypothetical protein
MSLFDFGIDFGWIYSYFWDIVECQYSNEYQNKMYGIDEIDEIDEINNYYKNIDKNIKKDNKGEQIKSQKEKQEYFKELFYKDKDIDNNVQSRKDKILQEEKDLFDFLSEKKFQGTFLRNYRSEYLKKTEAKKEEKK